MEKLITDRFHATGDASLRTRDQRCRNKKSVKGAHSASHAQLWDKDFGSGGCHVAMHGPGAMAESDKLGRV